MFNAQNILKYFLMLSIVSISTFYIPNCSIMYNKTFTTKISCIFEWLVLDTLQFT